MQVSKAPDQEVVGQGKAPLQPDKPLARQAGSSHVNQVLNDEFNSCTFSPGDLSRDKVGMGLLPFPRSWLQAIQLCQH